MYWRSICPYSVLTLIIFFLIQGRQWFPEKFWNNKFTDNYTNLFCDLTIQDSAVIYRFCFLAKHRQTKKSILMDSFCESEIVRFHVPFYDILVINADQYILWLDCPRQCLTEKFLAQYYRCPMFILHFHMGQKYTGPYFWPIFQKLKYSGFLFFLFFVSRVKRARTKRLQDCGRHHTSSWLPTDVMIVHHKERSLWSWTYFVLIIEETLIDDSTINTAQFTT